MSRMRIQKEREWGSGYESTLGSSRSLEENPEFQRLKKYCRKHQPPKKIREKLKKGFRQMQAIQFKGKIANRANLFIILGKHHQVLPRMSFWIN